MNKIIGVFVIGVFAISCGSSEEKTKDSGETKKEEKKEEIVNEKPDTLYLIADYKNPLPEKLTKVEREMFKLFFTDSLNAELFALNMGFDSIQTERQMLIYYRALIKFRDKASNHLMDLNASEEMNNKVMAELAKEGETEKDEDFDDYRLVLDYIREKLEPADKFIHGLTLTCVAECTEPSYDLKLNDLISKAKESTGESDEKFIQTIIDFYTGDYDPNTMNAKWFEPTWDYGGMSKLGDGHHLAFLKTTDKLIEEKNIFVEFLSFYRDDCFHDLTVWRTLANSKEVILKELKQILKEIKLDKKQKDAILIRQKEIESFKTNSTDGSGLQMDCETKDCMYG